MSSSEEKRGLTHSFRSQTGYGTAVVSAASKKSVPKTRKFISKKVSRTDTLIGIALKYGVTVQDLKKENRLWTNDSLFLRETLLIPLGPENEGVLDPDDVIVSIEGNSPSATTTTSPHQSSSSSSLLLQHHNDNGNAKGDHSTSSSSAVLEVESSAHSSHHHRSSLKQSKSSSSSSSLSSSTASALLSSPSSSHSIPDASSSSSSATAHLKNGSPHTSSSSGLPENGRGDDGSGGNGGGFGSDDFFSKYDVTIAKLKGDVAKMESSASTHLNGFPFLQENPMALPFPAHKSPHTHTRPNSRRHSSSHPHPPSSSSPSSSRRASSPTRPPTSTTTADGDHLPRGSRHDSPVLVIRSRTNSKMVKTTLERSRQASEDLFEL